MAKLIAGVSAVLFVVTAVLALLLISVDGVLLNAATYKRALVEQRVYEQAPALIAEQLPGGSGIPGVGGEQMAYLSLLSPADWKLLVGSLFPPADLQQVTEDGLDQVFSYLRGDSDSARVSLVVLKQDLSGPALQQAIKLVLAAQRPCSLQQLTQIAASIFSGSRTLILCEPPAELLEAAVSFVQTSMGAVATQLPDEAVLIQPASSSVPASGGGPLGNDPRSAIRAFRVGARFSPLLPLGLLLLVALFGVRSLKGWLRWWGIPLLIAGLIALGVSTAAAPMLDWAWANYVAIRIPSLISPGISGVAHDLLDSVAHQLADRIMLGAGLLVLLGLATTVISFFVDKKPPGPAYTRR